MNSIIINLFYLLAALLFVMGIKGLTRPKTAVRGNRLAALGMLLAIVITLLDRQVIHYDIVFAGLALGTLIGVLMAVKVQMTSMPQMVAILNGLGGGASLGVAAASYFSVLASGSALSGATLIITNSAVMLTVLIGTLTFSGSAVAFGKLQEILPSQAIGFSGMKFINLGLLLASVAVIFLLVNNQLGSDGFLLLVGLALLLGVTLVMPIGGADMPVVIALLNAYSGMAAAAAGFIMGNNVLIVSGALVGASGLILTQIMCVAMNRSLLNVLFGKMAVSDGLTVDADEVYQGKVTSATPDEVGMMLEGAQRVVIVPGFGLAMAQAQHAVRELADTLVSRGAIVEFAIHPVAGRMPGHMNVLLAEAEVDYEAMKTMEQSNPHFSKTDVVLVIGANDVTNPMAREDKGSPIYGMPILNVDAAKSVVVIKRSLSPGFAGLPNPLFAMDNAVMLFGDGKQAIMDLTASLHEAA
ncbi:NAD(P)(+) transhydrogenase (Re/Si-specific) subunit beta [Amphritea sp. 1_MG-2023]|uniref:NAD(P)(+) transhydrogenase (Re/Si-specific) subunit beta n=1 Tax=Amphritea sp. 1_MG-2023 TaxID=3062670 RepID=UPI0026E1A13E|nr:NAD(P)(+) transhydrogenase (Re/Si-specific) subunit beta [Amphritea sp. 1_MG-2023]MDO6564746.1 NAD(P)(+) transhydrogenase (Re/Si-specific) subunit beta [Amphritea sp. 1_MG-2023]